MSNTPGVGLPGATERGLNKKKGKFNYNTYKFI